MKHLGMLFIAVLLLGCTGLQNGVDPVSSAKSSDAIQGFLKDHPDAKIVSQYLTKDKASLVLKKYLECDLVDAQPMYYVTFKDDQLTAAAFISVTQEPLCIVTAPKSTPSSTPMPSVKPMEEPAIPIPSLTPTPTAIITSSLNITPYAYDADLPDSTALKAADIKTLFGCTDVVHDLDSSRWLEPKLPIASCRYDFSTLAQNLCRTNQTITSGGVNITNYDCVRDAWPELNAQFEAQGGFFRQRGYGLDLRERYVVFSNGATRLITTEAQFREIFGPVDSPAEAIAFADLLNDFIGLKVDLNADFVREYREDGYSSYVYGVSEIHGTHAEKTEGGYLVNLFDTFPGGCSSGISQINLVVKSDGSVAKKPLYPQVLSDTRVALPDVRMAVAIARNDGPIMCA